CLGVLLLRDIASDPEQLLGSAVRSAQDSAFDCDPAFSIGTVLVSERRQAVFGPAASTIPAQPPKARVHTRHIVRVDLRSHLSKGLGWFLLAMSVNVTIAHVVFEATAFKVNAPST